MVQGFNLIGTDAINVGHLDFAGGLPFLTSLAAQAEFPFLSATLANEQGELIFEPYALADKGGLKLALIGASGSIPSDSGYRSLDLLPALEQAVKNVKSQSDLIVLLFHGSAEERQQVLDSGLPIELIIQSHDLAYSSNFNTAIPYATAGSQGKYINLITLTIGDPGEPFADLARAQQNLRFVERTRKSLRRGKSADIPLEEIYADDPKTLARVELVNEREAEANRIIKTAKNGIESKRIVLNKDVADDIELATLVNEAVQSTQQIGAEFPAPERGSSTAASTGRTSRVGS
jgi:2',3'-cyclic-nucleotide 2'-phosphodiesterase (5'-nucleotidase family)